MLSVLYPLVAEALPCMQEDRLSANSTTCRPCLFQNVTCFLYLKCQERCSPRMPKISHYYNTDIKPPMFQTHQSKTSVLQVYSRKGSTLLERKRERDTRGAKIIIWIYHWGCLNAVGPMAEPTYCNGNFSPLWSCNCSTVIPSSSFS